MTNIPPRSVRSEIERIARESGSINFDLQVEMNGPVRAISKRSLIQIEVTGGGAGPDARVGERAPAVPVPAVKAVELPDIGAVNTVVLHPDRTARAVESRLDKLASHSDPTRKHLQPVINWDAYTKTSFRSEMADGDALLTALLAGTVPVMFTIPFYMSSFYGVGIAVDVLTACGVVYLAGFGLVERHVRKHLARRIAQVSEAHVRTWLKKNYGIVPRAHAFNDPALLNQVVNDGAGEYSWRQPEVVFIDESGHSYTLRRDSRGANLDLVSTRFGRKVPRLAPTVAFKPRANDEDLLAFPRRERVRVTAARDLIQAHTDATLPVEVRFALDRADRMLRETIELARKISGMPNAGQKQGYRELATVLDTITTELADLDLNQHGATLRQAKILARYSRNIRRTQTNPHLGL